MNSKYLSYISFIYFSVTDCVGGLSTISQIKIKNIKLEYLSRLFIHNSLVWLNNKIDPCD